MSRSTNCAHHPNRRGTHLRMRPAYSRLPLEKKYYYVCDECASDLVKEKREQHKDTILSSRPVGVFTEVIAVLPALEDLDEAAEKARKSA